MNWYSVVNDDDDDDETNPNDSNDSNDSNADSNKMWIDNLVPSKSVSKCVYNHQFMFLSNLNPNCKSKSKSSSKSKPSVINIIQHQHYTVDECNWPLFCWFSQYVGCLTDTTGVL